MTFVAHILLISEIKIKWFVNSIPIRHNGIVIMNGKKLYITLVVFHAYQFINNKTIPLWYDVRKSTSLRGGGGRVPVIQSEVSAGGPRAILRLLLHTANRRPLRQLIAHTALAHNHAK